LLKIADLTVKNKVLLQLIYYN